MYRSAKEVFQNMHSIIEAEMILYNCITTCYHVCLFVFLFIDINECEMEIDNCHENATCNNTFGSFECTCIAGFDGEGVECTSKIIGKGPSIHYQYVNKSLPGIF